MIYMLLKTISVAIYTMVSIIWNVQQVLINLMMSGSLMLLRLICQPMLIVPVLLGIFYLIFKMMRGRNSGISPRPNLYRSNDSNILIRRNNQRDGGGDNYSDEELQAE